MLQHVRELAAELYRRDSVLALTGWLHLLVLAVMLCVAPFDARMVTGVNPWLKPAKFAVSITIYVWTLGWLLHHLSGRSPRAVRFVSWGVAFVFVAEMLCLVSQAARGTTSHFNVATAYDGTVFGLMGVLILINTLLVFATLVLFCLDDYELSPAYLWGIRFGLLLFLTASVEGFVMISQMAHTVGAPDGGPGLPIVNWSTRAGDLRVAHFLGFHALQLLPLAGYALDRWRVPPSRRVAYMFAAALAYAALFSLLFWQATAGRPLVPLGCVVGL